MKWFALIFTLFIILIIILADLGELGFLRATNAIPFFDKAGHFILYGILTWLLDLAFIRSRPDLNRKLILFRVAFGLVLLIGIEEVSQFYFPKRTFELLDLAFSYLGVFFFSILAARKM